MKCSKFLKAIGIILLIAPSFSFCIFGTGLIDAIQLRELQSVKVTKKTVYLGEKVEVIVVCLNSGQVVGCKTIACGENEVSFDTNNLATGRYAVQAVCITYEGARHQRIDFFIE